MNITVTHDAARQRFEATVEGVLCVADYRLREGVMVMTHTGVPPAVAGRGIAGELVRAALEHAREHGLQVEPMCSYVDAWMRRHPDSESLRRR